MTVTGKPNSALSESIRLMLELHKLFLANKPDSVEADELRGEMEHYWWRLSENEQAILEGLSADLNTIGTDRRTSDISLPADETNEFKHFVESNEWHKVLEITRSNELLLAPNAVANIRGVAWMQLGFPLIALVFFEELERFGKLDPIAEIWYLTGRIKAKQILESIPRAQEIAATEQNPLLLMKAAHILSLAAEQIETPDRRKLRQTAIALAKRSIDLLNRVDTQTLSLPEQDILDIERVATLLHLAFDLALEGDLPSAQARCEEVLRFNPDNSDARLLLAWIMRDQNEQKANDMFFSGLANRLSAALPQHLSVGGSTSWAAEAFTHN